MPFDKLPQGWAPALEALNSLPARDSRVWEMPRAAKPLVERMVTAWDLAESACGLRDRGDGLTDADVQAAVEAMREAIELKWRLGNLMHCGEEFDMLARLLAATDPSASARYARMAVECGSRLALATSSRRHAKRGRASAEPLFGSASRGKPSGDPECPSEAEEISEAPAVSEGVVAKDLFDPESMFLSCWEDGRIVPMGPFEPIWTSASRTGVQQMMDGSCEPTEHPSFAVWTFEGGTWSVMMVRDKFESCMRQARACVAQAREARFPLEPAAAATTLAVRALDAFVNQLLNFIVLEGREAWPDSALRDFHDDLAKAQKIGGPVRKLELAGNGIAREGWLGPDLKSELRSMTKRRNEIAHGTVEEGRPLTATWEVAGLGGSAAREWADAVRAEADAAVRLATKAVECVESAVSTLREAYVARHGLLPAEPPDPPPGAPRVEMIRFGDGPDGPVYIPGFTLPASSPA